MSVSRDLQVSPLLMTAVGSALVVGSLLWYQVSLGASSVISANNIVTLEETAYATLGSVTAGLVLVFVGFTSHLQGLSPKDGSNTGLSSLTRLSSIISEKRSTRVFALASVCYGLFFGVVSNTLVFQPGIAFSNAYGVNVPSIVPVVCCSGIGQMPQLVIYITQQFAILLVPLNLVLLFVVSWLVGLNASIATYALSNRPRIAGAKWIGGLGALVGLFTVCPSCAGFFFLAILGLGGAVGLVLTLSSLQAVFIATGIPILMVTPILASRGLWAFQTCAVNGTKTQE